MPDNIINDLFSTADNLLMLACDGDRYGLSVKQMDKCNEMHDLLADFLAEVGPFGELVGILDELAAHN